MKNKRLLWIILIILILLFLIYLFIIISGISGNVVKACEKIGNFGIDLVLLGKI